MIPVMCIVQEGQISLDAQHGLKAQISNVTQRAFASPADIDWVVVPIGSGFTAAEPSRAVVVSLHADRPLAATERLTLLKELGALCVAQTGCSANEVMVSIRNPEEV